MSPDPMGLRPPDPNLVYPSTPYNKSWIKNELENNFDRGHRLYVRLQRQHINIKQANFKKTVIP